MWAELAVLAVLASAYAFGAVEPFWTAAVACVLLLSTALGLVSETRAPNPRTTLPKHASLLLLCCAVVPFLTLCPVGPGLRAWLAPGAADLLREIGVTEVRALSLDSGATFRAGVLAAAAAGTAYMVARAARSGPQIGLRTILVAGGVVLAAFGLAQRQIAYDPSRIYWSVPLAEVGTPFGPYVNRNHFAGAMALLGPAAAGLALHLGVTGRRRAAVAAWFAVALMAEALVATASRGGVMAGAAAAAVIVIGAGGLKRPRVLLAGGAAVVVGLALLVVLGVGRELLERFVTAPLTVRWENRFLVQRDALAVFADNPWFGTGAGSFDMAYPPFQTIDDTRHFGDAHSDWAQFLMELGLAGVALLAAIVGVVAGPLRRALRAPLPERSLVLGPLAGCVAVVVHGFVDVNLHVPSNALLATVSLSLAYGAALGAGLQRSPEIADEQGVSAPGGCAPGEP